MSGCEVKVPALRFKGYPGAWEKNRLGEFGDCQSGEGFSEIEQGGKVGIPFFKVSDMNLPGNESELVAANNYVTDEQIKRCVWHPVEQLPAVFFAKVGAAVLLNRKRIVRIRFLLDNNTMAFRLHDSINPDFAKSLFDTIDLPALSQTGALPSINASDVEDVQCYSPSLPEQRRIGSLFRSLDALIAGREKALEKLEALKKSMLLKMFPQGDATVPEVRFKGFAGEWEKSSFDEMFIHIPSKAFQIQSTDYRESGQFPVVDQGKVRIVGYTDNAGKVFKAKDNPVIVFGDHTREVKFVDFDFVVGADGTQLLRSPKNDIQFMSYVVQSTPLPNMGYSRHFKFLQEATFLAPTLPEQHKIGAFFRSLDALIAARREEIGKLKQMKKALLERMFV